MNEYQGCKHHTCVTDGEHYECPYCGALNRIESEDYSEDNRVEECCECGKFFCGHQNISILHYANPNCEINNEPHKYAHWTNPTTGSDAWFCEVCGDCTIRDPSKDHDEIS